MVRVLTSLIALLALMTGVASAHGPSRQKVVESIEINAPADKVWAVVGNFGDMSWHPAMAKTEATGNEAGATRVLTTGTGGKISEKLTKYNAEGKSLSYEITDVDVKVVPVTNYSATITVTGSGDKSTVEWKGAFYRGYVNNDPPPELSDEAAVNCHHRHLQGRSRQPEEEARGRLMPLASARRRPSSARPRLSAPLLACALLLLGADVVSAGDAREALVTNQTGDSLSVVDLATFKAVAEIKIGGKPAGVALSPDGTRAYVTSPESKELVIVDAETRSIASRSRRRHRTARNCGRARRAAGVRRRLVCAQAVRGRSGCGESRRRS